MAPKLKPGQLSDLEKLKKDRENIVRSMEQIKNVPQSERMYPSLVEQIVRKVERRRERARLPKAPPLMNGAWVIGTKKQQGPV